MMDDFLHDIDPCAHAGQAPESYTNCLAEPDAIAFMLVIPCYFSLSHRHDRDQQAATVTTRAHSLEAALPFALDTTCSPFAGLEHKSSQSPEQMITTKTSVIDEEEATDRIVSMPLRMPTVQRVALRPATKIHSIQANARAARKRLEHLSEDSQGTNSTTSMSSNSSQADTLRGRLSWSMHRMMRAVRKTFRGIFSSSPCLESVSPDTSDLYPNP